jgi:hypothetical protein
VTHIQWSTIQPSPGIATSQTPTTAAIESSPDRSSLSQANESSPCTTIIHHCATIQPSPTITTTCAAEPQTSSDKLQAEVLPEIPQMSPITFHNAYYHRRSVHGDNDNTKPLPRHETTSAQDASTTVEVSATSLMVTSTTPLADLTAADASATGSPEAAQAGGDSKGAPADDNLAALGQAILQRYKAGGMARGAGKTSTLALVLPTSPTTTTTVKPAAGHISHHPSTTSLPCWTVGYPGITIFSGSPGSPRIDSPCYPGSMRLVAPPVPDSPPEYDVLPVAAGTVTSSPKSTRKTVRWDLPRCNSSPEIRTASPAAPAPGAVISTASDSFAIIKLQLRAGQQAGSKAEVVGCKLSLPPLAKGTSSGSKSLRRRLSSSLRRLDAKLTAASRRLLGTLAGAKVGAAGGQQGVAEVKAVQAVAAAPLQLWARKDVEVDVPAVVVPRGKGRLTRLVRRLTGGRRVAALA